MPFFERDDENNTWVAAHHPFTMPMEECLEYLDTDPANVRAKAWDLVLNGTELSSGSVGASFMATKPWNLFPKMVLSFILNLILVNLNTGLEI